MAISNLSVFGGAFFTPVIVGVIESTLGWPWTFKFVAIFAGAVFPLLFLFCFETAYPRSINAEQEALAAVGAAQVRRTDQVHVSNASSEPDADSTEKEAAATTTTGARLANTEPWSFKKSLSPFNGRKTDEHFLKVLIRPLPLFLNPGILWACFIQGCIIGWTVLIGIVIAAIFLGPPLFFTSRQAGYLYAGAFIGAIAGFLICGLVADPGIRLLTRLNNGVYEPEFRILLVGFLSLVFGAIGLYGFGYTSADQYRWGWLIPDVFFGFEVAGMVCGAIASALYIADAHRDVAIEGFTCLLIFKNLFSFGLTLHGFDWLATRGITQVFVIVASVHVGISALSFPMCKFRLSDSTRSDFGTDRSQRLLRQAQPQVQCQVRHPEGASVAVKAEAWVRLGGSGTSAHDAVSTAQVIHVFYGSVTPGRSMHIPSVYDLK